MCCLYLFFARSYYSTEYLKVKIIILNPLYVTQIWNIKDEHYFKI